MREAVRPHEDAEDGERETGREGEEEREEPEAARRPHDGGAARAAKRPLMPRATTCREREREHGEEGGDGNRAGRLQPAHVDELPGDVDGASEDAEREERHEEREDGGCVPHAGRL